MHHAGFADASARAFAVAAVLGATALLLAGCADMSRPAPSATRLPPGITASIVPPSGETSPRVIEVELRNDSGDPLEIARLRVADDRFAGAAVRARSEPGVVEPGRTERVPMRVPRVDCEAPETDRPVITLAYTLGPSSSVAVTPVDDPEDVLSALVTQECGGDAH